MDPLLRMGIHEHLNLYPDDNIHAGNEVKFHQLKWFCLSYKPSLNAQQSKAHIITH